MSAALSNILIKEGSLAFLLGLGCAAAAPASWPGVAMCAVKTCVNGELAV